ncbi:MAG: hypothetical protein IPH65_14590 [Dehalococcoidia bacterium]|uniref:hypothetical protein n=1 Tax=Candidatus Amarobacter glycogenicus TaxID=3140699 RepID=UPI0031352E6E|nr:hypothetical protein [Dehalococcoidia bacterium]
MTIRLDEGATQTTVSGGLSNSRESVGSATLTMLKSIVAMNVPKQTAMRQRHLYSISPESTAAGVKRKATHCGTREQRY